MSPTWTKIRRAKDTNTRSKNWHDWMGALRSKRPPERKSWVPTLQAGCPQHPSTRKSRKYWLKPSGEKRSTKTDHQCHIYLQSTPMLNGSLLARVSSKLSHRWQEGQCQGSAIRKKEIVTREGKTLALRKESGKRNQNTRRLESRL